VSYQRKVGYKFLAELLVFIFQDIRKRNKTDNTDLCMTTYDQEYYNSVDSILSTEARNMCNSLAKNRHGNYYFDEHFTGRDLRRTSGRIIVLAVGSFMMPSGVRFV
jgi:hypothetical protein